MLTFYPVFSDITECSTGGYHITAAARAEVSSFKLSVSLKTDSLEHHLIRCSTRSHNLNVFQPSEPVFNWGLPYVYCHRMREVVASYLIQLNCLTYVFQSVVMSTATLAERCGDLLTSYLMFSPIATTALRHHKSPGPDCKFLCTTRILSLELKNKSCR